jgi:DNA-binding MarR family transcriptional regulator
MSPELLEIANAVRVATGVLKRRVRDDGFAALSQGEMAVLSRLDRGGPATTADLARVEGITPQAMGATVGALQSRGLIDRVADASDGRRRLLSPSAEGLRLLRQARDAVVERLAAALEQHFTAEQVALIGAAAPLIERLGQLM